MPTERELLSAKIRVQLGDRDDINKPVAVLVRETVAALESADAEIAALRTSLDSCRAARECLEQAATDWEFASAGLGWLRPHEAEALRARVAELSQAAKDVLAERQRQISVEGWTPAHDDSHHRGEMALAASSYALAAATRMQYRPNAEVYASTIDPGHRWPWDRKWWKPTTPRRDMVKAAALILAEIERLDRAAPQEQSHE